jgi:peptidoglycan/xylan/chitin deacetylase (PgdA/CDA1 family)
MDADVFEKRLAHVLRRFQVISLSEAVQHVVEGKHFAKRCAVITVDDGYRECHSVLLPMFLRYHVPATLFITTGVIETGKTFWFDRLGDAFFATCSQVIEDDQLGVSENIDRIHDKIRAFRKVLLRLSKLEDAERERLVEEICAILNGTGGMQERLYLTWKEIKNMAQSPMLTIGTHSTNHSNLSKAGLECAKGEIEGSAASIERHTGIAVRFVAYPGGVYSPALLEWLRTSTFQGACSSSIGVETDPYRLKRVDMAQQPSYLFTFEISVPNMLFRRWKSKRSGQKSEKPNI